ncbi:MAG: DUF2007 domain-containing protein [Deinococcota bacterium]|nr:DUF2007 domain-containing protein [Deinococcota bacterium]
MKGENILINGDMWTVVDVAPAAPLAEMVAALLEDEGFVVMTRAPGRMTGVLTHLGTESVGVHYVLVPEASAEEALALIADTVTDYEGEELDSLLEGDYQEGDDEAPVSTGDGDDDSE